MKKTTIAIGCLVQWYECDIIGEYINSLKDAISNYDGKVLVDIEIIVNEDLEKCTSREKKDEIITKIIHSIGNINYDLWHAKISTELVTIADYRRNFNDKYCEKADILMWGESDALIPQQTFAVLDNLHNAS